MTLTVKLSEAEYVEKLGAICPLCEADEISAGPVEIEGSCAIQEVSCLACGGNWNDVYALVGYSELRSE